MAPIVSPYKTIEYIFTISRNELLRKRVKLEVRNQ